MYNFKRNALSPSQGSSVTVHVFVVVCAEWHNLCVWAYGRAHLAAMQPAAVSFEGLDVEIFGTDLAWLYNLVAALAHSPGQARSRPLG